MSVEFELVPAVMPDGSKQPQLGNPTYDRQKLSSIRVAFIGNMNNNHFAMARFLRDRGVRADVLMFNNLPDHFHPSADAYDLEYMEFTRRLDWGSADRFLSTPVAKIRRDLAPYQVLIGCGLSPAYCQKAGRALDIFVPYGADLWEYTFLRLTSPHILPSVWSAAQYQKRGIRRANIIHMAVTNDLLEARCRKLRRAGLRWVEGLPMVYSATYAPESIRGMRSRTHWAHEFESLRRKHELMVVYHARHRWRCRADDLNDKGTDQLLKGWALFRARHPGMKAVLVTMEYGDDVLASKALIRELGITDSVAWLPRMCRKDIMVGLSMADIVCGEFKNNWMTSGVLYEALAVAKPILAWRDDTPYREVYPDLYPILCARDPQSIVSRIEDFLADPAGYIRGGEQGRDWYQREIVEKSLSKYLGYINERATRLAP